MLKDTKTVSILLIISLLLSIVIICKLSKKAETATDKASEDKDKPKETASFRGRRY